MVFSGREPIADDAGVASGAHKSILLFSDGTGNSSARIFKTNVWRTYEAADLGPAASGKNPQIAYYDDGVGTSSFKPLAMLGGAVGWGLKRNVLDLYRYACRNYRPAPGQQPGDLPIDKGDRIYGFGFSRGAFTMRIVIALIASQGLVISRDERQLSDLSKEAYRAFRADFLPRKLHWPTKAARRLRDSFRRLRGREVYDATRNYHPVIRFMGVWDTVAAYGGPFVELTRVIDDWIFPLSMPDYQLSDRVHCARHALALDDERDSFHPLVWDEVHESERVAAPAEERPPWLDENRLQQVWFPGMHADVGGGYPDETLSYVSLLWMLEEARSAGLRTLDVITDRYRALANSYGPLHDSRSGIGSFYRYQPRRIASWLDPVDPLTIALRDPVVLYRRKPDQTGLLRTVRVHESAIARIASGTDRYAPLSLPQQFVVIPPHANGEASPQADSDRDPVNPHAERQPLVSPQLRTRLSDEIPARNRIEAMESVWDLVWYRRVSYFLTITLTLALAALPLWADRLPELSPMLTAPWIAKPLELAASCLPWFAEPWGNGIAANAFPAYVLIAMIGGGMRVSSALQVSLHDRARTIWESAMGRASVAAPASVDHASWVRTLRNSAQYQRGVQILKWTALPQFVIGPALIVAALWLMTGLLTPFGSHQITPQPASVLSVDMQRP